VAATHVHAAYMFDCRVFACSSSYIENYAIR
jgi:hypothetical protein